MGNQETAATILANQSYFVYDVDAPSSTITTITESAGTLNVSQQYFDNISAINGTAHDMYEPSFGGVNAVYLYVKNPVSGYCWDQTAGGGAGGWTNSYSGSGVANLVPPTYDNWTWNASSVTFAGGGGHWSHGGVFEIRSMAVDSAYPGNNTPNTGNYEQGANYILLSSAIIVYDPDNPVSQITNIPPAGSQSGWANSLPTISGTVSDLVSGVNYSLLGYNPVISTVTVNIVQISPQPPYTYKGGGLWDSGQLTDNAHWLPVTGFSGYSSGTWTFNATWGGADMVAGKYLPGSCKSHG